MFDTAHAEGAGLHLVRTYLDAEQRLALLAEQRALRDVAELVEAHVRARRHLCES